MANKRLINQTDRYIVTALSSTGLYPGIWLFHAFPNITESLKTKSPLDQRLLVIVHHRFGLNFHLMRWQITDVRINKPEMVNFKCGHQQVHRLLAAWWNCVLTQSSVSVPDSAFKDMQVLDHFYKCCSMYSVYEQVVAMDKYNIQHGRAWSIINIETLGNERDFRYDGCLCCLIQTSDY